MKVTITLDRYDGSQGKSVTVDLETFPVRDLIYSMMEADVCGFTVTKDISAGKLIREMDKLRCESQ